MKDELGMRKEKVGHQVVGVAKAQLDPKFQDLYRLQ